MIETEDEDTESSNPLDGNKDASRDAFKEHRDSPAPIKNTPIANKIIYKLFCFEGANEHPIQGASPHQGQKYSSKPKKNIDSSYNWYQERLKTMKASIANSVAGLVLEQAERGD